MLRASSLPEGVTAPVVSGFSIQERMKRTSSSRRMPFFCSKRRLRASVFIFFVFDFCSHFFWCGSNLCSIFFSSAPLRCSNSWMCCSIVFSSAPLLNSKRRFCCSSFCSSRAGSGILGLTLRNNCRIDLPTRKGRKCGGQAAISSSRAGPTQQFFDFAEESCRFRLGVLGRQSFEFVEQFTLALAEFLRRLDQNLNVHIAGLF